MFTFLIRMEMLQGLKLKNYKKIAYNKLQFREIIYNLKNKELKNNFI